VRVPDNQRADWDDIRGRAERLVGYYGARDALAEEMRRMYHMEWTEDRPAADWIKETMSPTAYNTVTGAVRLMVSTEPQFSVSSLEGDAFAREKSEKLERAARIIVSGSGDVAGRPLHYEMVLASLLSAEVVGYLTRTADLVEYAKKAKRRGLLSRANEAAEITPYLINNHNPARCYTERDRLGVSAVMRKETVRWGDIVAMYGSFGEDALGDSDKLDTDVILYEWYDHGYRAVWVKGQDDPILWAEVATPFMPVVSQITDGSLMWSEPERQRTPFLYALAKSGLWKRENLMLTVIYSLVHGIGSNPLLVAELEDPDTDLVIDRTFPGGIIKTRKGERIGPLNEKIIDPAQLQGWQLAQGINEASTIPAVALGAPPSGALNFSSISLLTQSGRLPLIGTKQGVGGVLATLATRALRWMRESGDGKLYDQRTGLDIALTPDDIPNRVPMRCNLDVDLPQDKLQLANAAQAMKGVGVSDTYIQENVLGIGQPVAMRKERMREDLLKFYLEQHMAAENAKAQAQVQQGLAMMQQMAQAQAQGGADAMAGRIEETTPNGRPMPPELVSAGDGAYPPGGVGAQAGGPLAGPLPPRGM